MKSIKFIISDCNNLETINEEVERQEDSDMCMLTEEPSRIMDETDEQTSGLKAVANLIILTRYEIMKVCGKVDYIESRDLKNTKNMQQLSNNLIKLRLCFD
ncbi:Hypothetical_protein [Hexamita inflata]|uniref:Hypothetical_protein n=1 Tax=Hexamita inflata TaxID=28002 RepID=A0AA86UNU7_9EUKA|nr:Hypothetical protein HINF_LOCUS49919 [Hexamita inflata]